MTIEEACKLLKLEKGIKLEATLAKGHWMAIQSIRLTKRKTFSYTMVCKDEQGNKYTLTVASQADVVRRRESPGEEKDGH